jgi:flagellar biogenesis protein FliO
MSELLSIYSIDPTQTGKLRALRQAEVQEAKASEEGAKWAKIIALLIFIIALLMIPTFAVDEDQHQSHSSTVTAQAKGAG